jgi:hypothetical protein
LDGVRRLRRDDRPAGELAQLAGSRAADRALTRLLWDADPEVRKGTVRALIDARSDAARRLLLTEAGRAERKGDPRQYHIGHVASAVMRDEWPSTATRDWLLASPGRRGLLQDGLEALGRRFLSLPYDARPRPRIGDDAALARPYRQFTAAALLAVALVTVTGLLRRTSTSHPEVDALLEHLWVYQRINDVVSFEEWEPTSFPALDAVIEGDPLPDDVAAACGPGLDPADLGSALNATAELIYGQLYAAYQFEYAYRDLHVVLATADTYGVRPPPPEAFGPAAVSIEDWFGRPPAAVVEAWRRLETPTVAG